MARWTGTWLSGLGAAGVETRPEGGWRGRRWGLPPEGPGAVATTGSRIAALLVDVVVAALLGGLVRALVGGTDVRLTLADEVAFAVQVVLLTALTGQSVGKRVLGIRVVRLRAQDGAPGLLPALVRTALAVLVLPAVFMDRDGRGLHDRAAGTLVVRTRAAKPFAA